MSAEATPATRQPAKVRPFYWSVRRELWENPALYLAPLAGVAVVLVAMPIATFHLLADIRKVAAGATVATVNGPYAALAGVAFMLSFLVAVFYCLAALNNERRDRSILFWKSLPVSDLTTVLSKAVIPMVVQPLIIVAIAIPAQAILLAGSTLILLLNGLDPSLLWSQLNLGVMWGLMPYGLLVDALWMAPIYGWFFLVSAWAKRAAFVWALGPPMVLAFISWGIAGKPIGFTFLGERLFGGFSLAFMVGGQGVVPIRRFSQVDLGVVFGNPGLWIGLAVGAACLAACAWLRRRRDPI